MHHAIRQGRRTLLGALVATFLVAAVPAQALPVSVGSYSVTGLGADFPSDYDTFSITGLSFDVAASPVPQSFVIGRYDFEVGPNCYACTLTPTLDAVFDVTVGGTTLQVDMPFAWSSSGPADTLTFADAAALGFDLGALGTLNVAVDRIPTLTAAGGSLTGNVKASIVLTPVPEPGVAALLVAGLGLVAFQVRRRLRR